MPISEAPIDDKTHEVAKGETVHLSPLRIFFAVLAFIKGQIDANRDIAVDGLMQMMGQDDLFTKAAVESSIDKMDDNVGQVIPPKHASGWACSASVSSSTSRARW